MTDTITMSQGEIDALIARYAPTSNDVDVAVQNMWLEIERLCALTRELEDVLRALVDSCDEESPWRGWPDFKLRAWEAARQLLTPKADANQQDGA